MGGTGTAPKAQRLKRRSGRGVRREILPVPLPTAGGPGEGPRKVANYMQKMISLVHVFVTVLHIFNAYKLN